MRGYLPIGAFLILAAVLGGWWLATGGLPPPDAPPSWLESARIAHRGLHTDDARRPENSLAAFGAAVQQGYPIELDVHLTADGVVVVLHDNTLERMTGDPRRVAEIELGELRELRLLGTDERVPTLREVLDLVDGAVPLLVEVKNPSDTVGPLENAVVDELKDYRGEVAIQSFNPFSLAAVRDAAPEIPRGQLSGSFEGEDLALHEVFVLRNLLMNWKSRPVFIAYELDALPTWGTTLQRTRGWLLLGWTATSPEELARADELCDGVIFDPGTLE